MPQDYRRQRPEGVPRQAKKGEKGQGRVENLEETVNAFDDLRSARRALIRC